MATIKVIIGYLNGTPALEGVCKLPANHFNYNRSHVTVQQIIASNEFSYSSWAGTTLPYTTRLGRETEGESDVRLSCGFFFLLVGWEPSCSGKECLKVACMHAVSKQAFGGVPYVREQNRKDMQ